MARFYGHERTFARARPSAPLVILGEPQPPKDLVPRQGRFFARLRTICRLLEVVPQPETDLLFELAERFELTRLAIVVMQPESHDLPCFVTPQPTGLCRQIATPIHFLTKVAVDGQKWRTVRSARARAGKLGAKLNFPRLRTAIAMKRIADFAIQPHPRLRKIGCAEHGLIPHIVNAVVEARGIRDDEFVAQMRAEVVASYLELPVIDAVSKRHAIPIIGRFKIAEAIER